MEMLLQCEVSGKRIGMKRDKSLSLNNAKDTNVMNQNQTFPKSTSQGIMFIVYFMYLSAFFQQLCPFQFPIHLNSIS